MMSRGTGDHSRLGLRGAVFLAAAVLVGSLARIVAIDRWPGVDGDEAWYGVNVQMFLEGSAPFYRTGIGNPLNPFHSGPLLLLSLVMEPSVTLLRMPEVFWGILAVVLAYPLLAPPLGRRAALMTAALIAVSPAAVAYARFGWDPSGTPLASLLAVGFALGDRPIAAVLCWLAALAVHPTNVFLAPIVAAAWGPHAVTRCSTLTTDRVWARVRLGAIVGVGVSIPLGLWLLDTLAKDPHTSIPSIELVVARIVSPSAWLDTGVGLLRLFSGVSTAASFAGPVTPAAQYTADLIAALILVAPLALGWRRFKEMGSRRGLWLLGGIGLSVVLLHIVAGPAFVHSPRERYALFLLVPLLILCAVGVEALAHTRPRVSATARAVVCAGLVASLAGGYFYPLATGAMGPQQLRTGPVEPKVAAYAYLRDDSRWAEVVTIVAEDWWIYWAMRYLAWDQRDRIHVDVVPGAPMPGALWPPGVTPRTFRPADKSYAVVFDGSNGWSRFKDEHRAAAFTASDPKGRPILHVVRISP